MGHLWVLPTGQHRNCAVAVDGGCGVPGTHHAASAGSNHLRRDLWSVQPTVCATADDEGDRRPKLRDGCGAGLSYPGDEVRLLSTEPPVG